jgi:hypothetical protein
MPKFCTGGWVLRLILFNACIAAIRCIHRQSLAQAAASPALHNYLSRGEPLPRAESLADVLPGFGEHLGRFLVLHYSHPGSAHLLGPQQIRSNSCSYEASACTCALCVLLLHPDPVLLVAAGDNQQTGVLVVSIESPLLSQSLRAGGLPNSLDGGPLPYFL